MGPGSPWNGNLVCYSSPFIPGTEASFSIIAPLALQTASQTSASFPPESILQGGNLVYLQLLGLQLLASVLLSQMNPSLVHFGCSGSDCRSKTN